MTDQRKQIDERLEQAKSLLENSRLVEAEKHTEKILNDFPRNAEALYILAVCQRYLNRLEEALKTLGKLKKNTTRLWKSISRRGSCIHESRLYKPSSKSLPSCCVSQQFTYC